MTKTESLKDRRLVDLKLTKCGKKIIDQMTMIAKDYESEVLAKIEDQEYFRKMLTSLINDKIA